MIPAEFPHSEISGSKDICSSPKLIAAYHVFHRLLVPRHSPCALFSLTVFLLWFSICQQDFLPLSEIVSHNISVMLLTTNKWFLKILFRSYYSVFKVHSEGRALKIEHYRMWISPVRNRKVQLFRFVWLPRKEVIQPQVLLRLPCYDFTPITSFTFGRVLL